MMSTTWKVLLSLLGAFLVPSVLHLQMHLDDPTWGPRFWLGAALAGLYPVGGYLMGFWQVNPANQPRTPEALLAAISAAHLPPATKTVTAEALGALVTTSAAAPVASPKPTPTKEST